MLENQFQLVFYNEKGELLKGPTLGERHDIHFSRPCPLNKKEIPSSFEREIN